jgi:hypothetical protein
MQRLRNDEFKGFAAAANSIDWNSLIERCQFAPFPRASDGLIDDGNALDH